MREIKFRAWNKGWKRGVVYFTLDKLHDGFVYCGIKSDVSINLKGTELMQYTGLHDKNGKEIYEGDIVKENDTYTAKIEFISGCFVYNFVDTPEDWSNEYIPVYGGSRDTEVIGNIYENPELLK